MINIVKFIQEVKTEMSRVSWPSRQETVVSATVVLVAVGVCALFFLMVDSASYHIIQQMLRLGH